MRSSSYAIIVSLSLLFTSTYEANAEQTYTVKKGDSLYMISKNFKIEIDKIKETNKLDSIKLKPGTKLIIQSREKIARRAETGDSDSMPVKKAAPSHNPENQYHIVEKGDTLSSIARKYSISLEDLRETNNIQKSVKIRIGQPLLIKKSGPKIYAVRKGDTIIKIAKKFNIHVEELIEINELESIELKQGQKLIVEAWVEEPEPAIDKRYTAILSESRMTEDLKSASESPDLISLDVKERVTLFAKKMLHIPYKFGGSTFMGIDCSAYVQKVFGLLDITLPRTAREQFNLGEPVRKEELSIGDLVFFRTYASFPSHVGIYLGDNLFIHASAKNRKVSIDNLDRPFYIKRFIGAKRFLLDEPEADKYPKEKS